MNTKKEIRNGWIKAQLWRRVLIGLVFLTISVIVLSCWLLYTAVGIKSSLEESLEQISTAQTHFERGDQEALREIIVSASENTQDARELSATPIWRGAAFLPVVGRNFEAVTEVVVSVDDVIQFAALPLAAHAASLNTQNFAPVNGAVETQILSDMAPDLATAARTVSLSYERLRGLETDSLWPSIAGPVQSARDSLSRAKSYLDTASSAANVLPTMLGNSAPRNYLILIQNSAEVRATGGIPGALSVLTVTNGRFEITGHGSATSMGIFKPAIAGDPEQEAIFTNRLGRFMQNVNLTPDFPTAAQTAKQMWEARNPDIVVDGVISLDPVVLANLLSATGPVVLSEETSRIAEGSMLPSALDETNVIKTLLSDVYAEIISPEIQDAYFAAVASEVFSAFTASSADGNKLLDAAKKSALQDRILAWSVKADERDLLSRLGLGGSVTDSSVGGSKFGLYYNDGTGAKMDYYVERVAQLVQECSVDGYSRFRITVEITNTAPLDAANTLPAYVTGGEVFGVSPGRVRTNYVAYGPAQALIEGAAIDGIATPLGTYRHGQRPVGVVTVELGPGETSTLELHFSHVVQTSDPELRVTPTLLDKADAVRPVLRDETCN